MLRFASEREKHRYHNNGICRSHTKDGRGLVRVRDYTILSSGGQSALPRNRGTVKKGDTSDFISIRHWIEADVPKLFAMNLIEMLFEVVHVIEDCAAKSAIEGSLLLNKFGYFFVGVKMVRLGGGLEGFFIEYLLEGVVFHLFLIDKQDGGNPLCFVLSHWEGTLQ